MEDLRRWAVADEGQDAELRLARAAAESYLLGAGVPEDDTPDRDMAILQLTLYYFDQRAPDARGGYAPPPPALRSIILQLRYGEGAKA